MVGMGSCIKGFVIQTHRYSGVKYQLAYIYQLHDSNWIISCPKWVYNLSSVKGLSGIVSEHSVLLGLVWPWQRSRGEKDYTVESEFKS